MGTFESRVIRNTRPAVDWNACGQAAIATMLAHWRLGPFVPGASVADGEAIDYVRLAFPPDVPLGLGTTANRVASALRGHGLQVERVHSGWFGADASGALRRVVAHVSTGHPVPVCLIDRRPGAQAGSAHWAIALAFEHDRVRLGNHAPEEWLPIERFLQRWRCPLFPYGMNHAAVLTWA